MSTEDENDPAVQKNGFRLLGETLEIPDREVEEFLDEFFDPTDDWEANHEKWTQWWSNVRDTITTRQDEIEGLDSPEG